MNTSVWAEALVDAPKIIIKDGNLIFESGADRNISIRLNGNSRLTLNEQLDVLELLLATGGSVKDDLNLAGNFKDLKDMADQLADFKRRAFGPNGMQSQLPTGTINSVLKMFRDNLTTEENNLERLRSHLEIDSCASRPCENGGTCYNTYGGFHCDCPTAFEGATCEVDVNECALYQGTDLGCQNGAECHNQFGSFSCLCPAGWHGMHCTRRKTDCSQSSGWELCGHGSCVPSSDEAGYRCLCDPGWKTNGVTPVCGEDVDECSGTAAHTPCSTRCINLPGSFTCAPCPAGLTGNGISCQDVDECQMNNGGCSLNPKANCINTYGSHHCAECPLGWTGDGQRCERITSDSSGPGEAPDSSCPPRNNPCHPAAACHLFSGTASCSCPMGMIGSGYGPSGCINGTTSNCLGHTCLNDGLCLDAGPSNFTCLCRKGFRPPICEPDSSPCDSNPCKNGGSCRAMGADSFECHCLPGFIGQFCSVRFSSCNGRLSSISGSLKYPPEDAQYDHNSQCTWLIRTDESLVLNVTFNSFDLEDSTECRFDWLQVNDGGSAADQEIGRFCGSQLPGGGNIVSSGNQLYLRFRSDNSTAKEGFDLTWNSIQPQCGGRFDLDTHGTLSSPGSPGNYPKNRDCQWHLVAPISKRIKLTFAHLQLEEHDNCNFDYVLIKDTISGSELDKFCSSGEPPEPLLLNTHQLEIHFHSDSEGSDRGFQLHYSTEENLPGCGGLYTDREGTISKSAAEGPEDESISCEYEIRLVAGEQIAIQFVRLVLNTADCLELLDVTDEGDSYLQDKICGTDAASSNPPAFTSQSNRMKIKFYAHSSSFQLNYRTSCDFTLDANEGILTSPGYPNLDNRDQVCTYTIKTAPNTVISVQRLDFQLKSLEDDDDNVGCLSTSLKITDGLNHQVLGPYCGKIQPGEDFVSQTNYLQYQLTTDADSAGRGFKFEYKALPIDEGKCGGVHTISGESIRMSRDSTTGSEAADTCYWEILAPINKAIRLHWTSFKLSYCFITSLEIYDTLDVLVGNGKKNKRLAQYCSIDMPEDLVIHSGQIVIKFTDTMFFRYDINFELSYTFEDREPCGGHIHASSGMLTSPGYPLNYSSGLDCDWHLTGRTDYQMEIQLDFFDLEQSRNCSGDYLEVRNGGGRDSPLMGRFCGTNIPTSIPSFGNELRILFHSDSAISGRGFRLRWRVLAFQCGGSLRSSTGVIESPKYPNPISKNIYCEWELRVPLGSGTSLLVEDIDLGISTFCIFNSVDIYFETRLPNKKADISICNTIHKDRRIDTASNTAIVLFNADVAVGRGFRISYAANCVQNLTAMSGSIESLNYMEPLWDNIPVNCSWTIRAPKGNHIQLEVSHLEHMPSSLPVGLYIIDGQNIQSMVAPGSLNSSGEAITVVHNASSLNFQLDYRMVGCLEEFHGESGSFHSPNYPKTYPNNLECHWLINVDPNSTIELNITDLDLEESVNCTKDALTVSNHKSEVEIHERHCGSTARLLLTSSGHKMYVRFISDGAHNGRGFTATYKTAKIACGGKILARNGVIQSPNYPLPYLRNIHCEWHVEVSAHHRIVFEVQDLAEIMFREFEYLEAFDVEKDDTEGQRLFKFIYGDEEYNIQTVSATNIALVRFNSGSLSGPDKGFRLNFHESCGQTVIIDSTDVKYIHLGRQAPRNESCVWVLQTKEPSKLIIFTPTDIKLRDEANTMYPTEEDCLSEGVKIYEGAEATGSPRLQYCRSHPPALISNGPALTISVPLLLVEEFEGNYMIMDTACGSVYSALSGRFSSPYYPASYPPNIECIWVLQASQGNSISLTIKSMDIEDSEGCNRDYLEVREGSDKGNLIGAYCGKEVPMVIHSPSSIWMKFRSDDDNVGDGFVASYNYARHNYLNGTDGFVESPHYPSRFEDSHGYSWLITVDEGYVVVISVLTLRGVDQQHLLFYDGYSPNDDPIEIIDPEEPIRSSTNVFFFTASRGPFRLSWQRMSKEALKGSEISCGRQLVTIDRSDIVLQSPGYPNGYEADLNCSWSLVPLNTGEHAVLQLVDLDLCFSVRVRISKSKDLRTWSKLLQLCTLPDHPTDRIFHGEPYLRVEFITHLADNRTGFKASVRTECGSHIVASEGQVNITELLAQNHTENQECVWTLEVRQGRRIKLDFPESLFQNNNADRIENFLILRNGNDEDSPFLGIGKYSEDNIQEVPETSSNRAYVKVHYVGTPRFRVSFRFSELFQECSRRIQLSAFGDEEFISSPLYPRPPHPHTECVWMVTAPPQHRIVLHFQDEFNLDFECHREYVQVNDGISELRPEIGRFCGSRTPDTIYSSGNHLRIRYYTDISQPHMGFRASLKLAWCGGSYHGLEGLIASPPPNILSNKEDEEQKECVYTIELEQDELIELQSEYLQLPGMKNGNCTHRDHLTIEEMAGEKRITSRRIVCGHDPLHLMTETNKVVIRYRFLDGVSIRDQGFRFRYKAVGTRCDETISAIRGVLQTPGYPQGRNTFTHCVWRLEVPKGQRVHLDIVDFDMPKSSSDDFTISSHFTIANDHQFQSVLWSFDDDNDRPASIESCDNTMAIEVSLRSNGHRGLKLRFRAFGTSLCPRLAIEQDVVNEMAFQGSNLTQPLYCIYDIEPPVNSTVLIQVKKYENTPLMMGNSSYCESHSPLTVTSKYGSHPLLNHLVCGYKPGGVVPSIRVPFPIQIIVSFDEPLSNLVLSYSMQACGGVHILKRGDVVTVTEPSGMDAIQGAIDCSWAFLDGDFLEGSLTLNLPTVDKVGEEQCQQHYLRIDSTPDDLQPLAIMCNEDTVEMNDNNLFINYHSDHFSPNATFNLTINAPSRWECGGRLYYPYPTVAFREQYKNNMECIWTLVADMGFYIELSFQDRFYIEESPGCEKDYLLVRQFTNSWTDIQKICGRQAPLKINTISGLMQLVFRSNEAVVGDGFLAKFERHCGDLFYAEKWDIHFQNPEIPKSYGTNVQCSWTIVPRYPSLGQHVLVTFPPMPNCNKYKLTLTMQDADDRVRNAQVCGWWPSRNYIASQSIKLVFQMDNLVPGQLFDFKYSAFECGGVVNTTGIIESTETTGTDCYWNLTAPVGFKFTIRFELLEIKAYNNDNCSYSGIEVYAGPIPDFRMRRARFCGSIKHDLPLISISQNQGLIYSYNHIVDQNSYKFRAIVSLIENCDEQIQLNGSLSYNFSKFSNSAGYAPNLDCHIVFRVNIDQQIKIRFGNFHLENSTNCHKDYVELRDGGGPLANIIGRFCGQDPPTTLQTSRHLLFLRFATDFQDNDSGFELNLRAVPRICGVPEIQLKSNGLKQVTLGSPRRVTGEDFAIGCFWKIFGDSPLVVTFVNFDLQGPDTNGSCAAEYLKIYSKEDAQLVDNEIDSEVFFDKEQSLDLTTDHEYCGTVKPDTYYANNGELNLRYWSSGLSPGAGFQVHISLSASCERHYGGLQGRVGLSATSDCNIMIRAQANHTLSLYINKLYFSSLGFEYCSNSLEVFDRNNRSLHRFCDNVSIGDSLFSYKEELRLQLKATAKLEQLDITYLATPVEREPGCGGQFYNTAGIFTNPLYPHAVRNHSDCRWIVRVPSNTKVLLNIRYIYLGSRSTCQTNYLQILEQDESGVESEIRRFCGNDHPLEYKSQRSQVVVRFHKTPEFDGTGWIIQFAGVHSNYKPIIDHFQLEWR
ncbi:cubilin homolog [Drosophila takahashii]|uniref:cubilin homolog n=1 Tax=Drosophila takahashii TaxID=29030 RepID=UPI001CF9105A|nr:cubilin homolog [Drosophila takahashii]